MANLLNFDPIDRYFREFLGGNRNHLSKDQKRRSEKSKGSQPFDKGRDPVIAGSSMNQLFENFNWGLNITKAELFSNWDKVVGAANAEASKPEELLHQELTIRCRSTAWATQLRLLESQILARISEEFPSLGVQKLKIIGPNVPTWKKGPRSVPGRGPRDTYG
jgi:predicted nucleic acid-binding Zn ribbon protein